MQIVELIQGTPQWHAHRAKHRNASDTPAVLGCSPYKSRREFLRERATGFTPEVDAATQMRFDDGHRFEALARPRAEEIIGEELYPVTGTMGVWSASFDGLTMDDRIAFEHKSFNDDIRTCQETADLPKMYRAQMEHQLMVSGAERALFMASKWDESGELLESRHFWYESDAALRQEIIAAWDQFDADVASFVPDEVIPAVVATPQMGLPAVTVQVQGSIAVRDNLTAFGDALTAYVERINKKPETDQDFADLEATVKSLKTAEEMLDAAESGALAQTASIDIMRRTVAQYRDIARTNRLMIEKLVKAEKENRRATLLREAQDKLATHIKTLNERLGKPYMPVIQPEFQAVIKGLKSIDSMRDKLDTELSRCKIEANAVADRIEINLNTLRELAKGHAHLFPDTANIVGKGNDDLVSLIKARIADESARLEAVRVEAERQAAEKAKRERLDVERKAQQEAACKELEAAQQHPQGSELSPAAQRINEESGPAPWNTARNRVGELLDRMTITQLAMVEKHVLTTFPHLQEKAA